MVIKRITRLFCALKESNRLFWLLLIFAMYPVLASFTPESVARQTQVTTTPAVQTVATTSSVPAEVAAEPANVSPATAPAPKSSVPAPTQACKPEGSPFVKAVDMTNLPAGYHESPTAMSYYTVYGNTPTEIYNQVLGCGPLFSNGVRYGAATSYHFNWKFDTTMDQSGTSCSLSNIRVAARSDVLMPSWQRPANANTKASSYWSLMSTKLLDHELGHADLSNLYAQNLYDQLVSLPAASSCSVVRSTANDIGQRVRNDTQTAQLGYDQATDHGRR